MTETAREAVARALGLRVEDPFDAKQAAGDALAAHHAWLDAHGWQIVPKEPTPAMAAEGKEASLAEGAHDCEVPMTDVYRAMLAAAPKPPGE